MLLAAGALPDAEGSWGAALRPASCVKRSALAGGAELAASALPPEPFASSAILLL